MPWARASSLHRFMECPAASWLPRYDDGKTKRPYLDTTIPAPLHPDLLKPRDMRAALLGRQTHARVEQGTAYPELWKGMDAKGEHEVAVSYCCKTGKVRWAPYTYDTRRKDIWKALQCKHAVVGTSDWLGHIGGLPWVDDLKTGWAKPEVLTAQLLFYALCWRDLTGAKGDVVVSITHWPKAKGAPTREGLWRRATPLMLEGFRVDLTDAWRRTTLNRSARPGAHCQWCPSVPWCSATNS